MCKTQSWFDLLPGHIKLYPGSPQAASGSNLAGPPGCSWLEKGYTGSRPAGPGQPDYPTSQLPGVDGSGWLLLVRSTGSAWLREPASLAGLDQEEVWLVLLWPGRELILPTLC